MEGKIASNVVSDADAGADADDDNSYTQIQQLNRKLTLYKNRVGSGESRKAPQDDDDFQDQENNLIDLNEANEVH